MQASKKVEKKIASASKRIVNSWDEFSPLKHIIVGHPHNGCLHPNEPAQMHTIPQGFGFNGKPGPRPIEHQIAAAKEMDHLASLLESHGVKVDRPPLIDWTQPKSTPWWETECEYGCMPPRDLLLVAGNEILEATCSYRSRWWEYRCYRDMLYDWWLRDHDFIWEAAPKPKLTDDSYKIGYFEEYNKNEETRLEMNTRCDFVTKDWEEVLFDAADVMRLGKDLIVGHSFTTNLAGVEWLRRHFKNRLRVHYFNFPGYFYPTHIDAVCIPLRPGLMMFNPIRQPLDYQRKFLEDNGWECVIGPYPDNSETPELCSLSPWLAYNILVIDEKHVLVEESEKSMQKFLKSFGFEVVTLPFRNVYEFGGALHCSTLDIYREGGCENYFPNLGPNEYI